MADTCQHWVGLCVCIYIYIYRPSSGVSGQRLAQIPMSKQIYGLSQICRYYSESANVNSRIVLYGRSALRQLGPYANFLRRTLATRPGCVWLLQSLIKIEKKNRRDGSRTALPVLDFMPRVQKKKTAPPCRPLHGAGPELHMETSSF